MTFRLASKCYASSLSFPTHFPFIFPRLCLRICMRRATFYSDVLDFVIVAANRTIPFVVQGDMATLALSLHS